ncbi:MAG: PilZ domain-containing protein [gamma proteobacterium symbiont of Bathyaustriella thionipta]|nr:PilZ domain-containing protein [gamma proteobacterium symbiont of Bathyaustriella thionipta]MCU7949754.1 PilZ domain-containing protein [gamma proteobacterium symbiont of Bathyaustriella thionipta]MCU7952477.1 PilZ domain-containing protein [gamma proteobacterium symbiont of Bathyaustriella thionipta]MCU7956348.1 PilZ domain-containing protein [gamma proteobacterium symbiont of Bathyaustriella thionipta]MCU7965809.1 PilZ domain-containing protein [gamma proteobacterium symbiont of Bathyaustr
MSSELRQHIRTPLTSSVKLTHPDTGTIEVKTKDISDGGIYLLSLITGLPPVGSQVKVQLIDTPFEAPVLDMIIVRMDPHGIGLKFLD